MTKAPTPCENCATTSESAPSTPPSSPCWARQPRVARAHSCSRSPPSPRGLSTLWLGPAAKPSSEMEMFAVTLLMAVRPPARDEIIAKCKTRCVQPKRIRVHFRASMATLEVDPRVVAAARASAPAVVDFRGVSKKYEGGDLALDDVSFSVRRGDFVFLVGATGSGKSTLMRLLLKELEPTAGTIRVAGHDLSEISRRRVPYYRRNIGMVFQDFKLLPNRTVYDNVAYALQVTGHSRREIREKVPDVLRLTRLSLKLHNYPQQPSGGEQQRVSVARAFVNHPPLLLADEPTGNLDPETSIGIMQLLYRINRTGSTVIVATHDSAIVDRMRRRVIELRNGRIVRDEATGLYAPQTTAEFRALLET